MTTVTGSCPYYSTTNYATCSIPACPGDTISVSGCGACTGQQKLYLYSGSTQLTGKYGGCGDTDYTGTICSALSYEIPSTYPCQSFTLREASSFSGSTSTGTVSYIVSPYEAPTVAPTGIPTVTPTLALPVYFQQYNSTTETCSSQLPALSGYMQSSGDCWTLYDNVTTIRTMLTCDSTSSDSAWVITNYHGDTCTTATKMNSVSGAGTCSCTEVTAGNITTYYNINCAGHRVNCNAVTPTSNGSSGSSDSATTGIIVGVVVGVVALAAIVVSVAAYYGVFKCTKPLSKAPETEMSSNL